MLTGLRLHQIALIEALELSFERGFTVLTGETGAGKSILLDALDALLGGGQGSAGVRLLRPGSERSTIEASFSLNPPLLDWLQEQQLDTAEEELVITREWRRLEERINSRSRVNGVVVSRAQLLELRPLLLELTVQGQTQQLARPGQQRRWLDRFGGDSLLAGLEPARSAQRLWKQAEAALERARGDRERLEQERQGRQQLLDEWEAARLEDPFERQALEADQDRLVHGVRLQDGVMTLIGRLQEGADGAPSVLDHLAACEQELQAMAVLDGTLQPQLLAIGEALAQVQDLARDLDRYGAGLESDPETLATLQDRIAQLRSLERRHGLDLSELIAERDRLRELLGPGGAAASLAELERSEAQARQIRERVHGQLSALRRQAAAQLQDQLMEALRPMGLANVRFAVAVDPAPASEDGSDAVQFLFSANPGQPLAPWRRWPPAAR